MRGFINGFLLFAFLSYGRLMIDHVKSHGSVFLQNAYQMIELMKSFDYFVFISIFTCFWASIYLLQKIRF